MRIVFAGTPEFAVPSLTALAASVHEVVGVITREDAPLGRKRILTPSPVAVRADEFGIPVLRTNRLDDAATEWVRERGADLGVIVAYGGLVRESLLTLPALGWINLHFSELPRWRGAAPVQRALAAGEQTLGLTVFRLVAALDAGDVLARDAQRFAPGTAAGAALTALADAGTATLARAIDVLAGDPDAGEPQTGEPTYAHKLTREDGRLDLGGTAEAVLAHWAGVTPEPGAYVLHDDQPLKIRDLAAAPVIAESTSVTHDRDVSDSARAAGSVRLVNGRAILSLRGGQLELVTVQPAGKPGMDGAAWLRGRDGSVVLA